MDMAPLFSVCICTRNRAALLAGALSGLASQTLPADMFEVLVVDNASSDGTAQVAGSYSSQIKNIRIIREETVGLSAARNRGAEEAAGEWVAYLDDDAIPPPYWLEHAREVILTQEPDLFGGPFYPYYTTPKPSWFKDQYGTGAYGDQPKWMSANEYLFGGNLFVRREALLDSGGFSLGLGPQGERLFYGDETGLIRRLRQRKPDLKVYYSPGVAIQHWVAPFKMTLAGRFKQRWAEGRSGYRAFHQPGDRFQLKHFLGLAAMPVLLSWHLSFGVLLRDRSRFPCWQNYIYEDALRSVAVWGKLYERMRFVWGKESVG